MTSPPRPVVSRWNLVGPPLVIRLLHFGCEFIGSNRLLSPRTDVPGNGLAAKNLCGQYTGGRPEESTAAAFILTAESGAGGTVARSFIRMYWMRAPPFQWNDAIRRFGELHNGVSRKLLSFKREHRQVATIKTFSGFGTRPRQS